MQRDSSLGWIPATARHAAVAGIALVALLHAGGSLAAAPDKWFRPTLPPPLPDARALQTLGSDHFTLVQLDPEGAWMSASLLRRAGGTLVSRRLAIWGLRSRAAARLAPQLEQAGLLWAAEPDRLLASSAQPGGDGPLLASEWWRAVVGADQTSPPGPGKPVTVIDTGIDLTQPEFAGRPNTIALNPQTITGGDEEHGTMVSSLIAAPGNGIGLAGVYPQAVLQIWDATPTPGDLTISSIIRGLEAAAAHGPGVVNMSFGGFEDDPLLREAIDVAFHSGLLLVAAAGNDRGSGSREVYPGSLPHVLTVGATDQSGAPASFSSATPGLDLVAPGENIPVAVPISSRFPSGFTTADGTSFSTPIVAGAAAWVWTVRPALDNTQIFDLIRFSATDIGTPGYDEDTGFGMLNIPHALTMAAPPPDPGEPNDDIFLVKPHGLFAAGAPPLTSSARPNTTIHARLDFNDDPEDVYPVFVPAHSRATITLQPDQANADLEVWRASTRTVSEQGAARKRDLLGASTRPGREPGTVTVANRTPQSEIVYADVFPAQNVQATSYALLVRTKTSPHR